MATVHFEGRQIPLDDAVAGRDDLLLLALIPHLGAELSHATINRQTKDGQMVVTLVKRAGPKGSVLASLLDAPEGINPALGLAWMLTWNDARGTLDLSQLLELQPAIEAAIEACSQQEQHTRRAITALTEAEATTASVLIEGF